MIPRWCINHIENLPDGLAKFLTKKLVDYVINKYAKINVIGKENLNEANKSIIFVCNHLSNSDGLILNKVLEDKNVFFVAGAKISKNSFTNAGRYVVKTITIVPNSADKDAIVNIINTVKSGNNVLMFPEGTRSRNGQMIKARKGIVLIQKLSRATIVPIGVWGTEKLMPINDSGMGEEKFFNADVNVSIGKPLVLPKKEAGEGKHEYEERATDYIMKGIADLLPEAYRGVYK